MTRDASRDSPDDSVLVFAPVGRDAELTRDLLDRAAIPCLVYDTLRTLADTVASGGAGTLLLTEEALDDPDCPALTTALEQQPPWSDVPVLLFAGGPRTDMRSRTIRFLEVVRNVTLIERPIRVAAVLSTIRAALRGRARQYEVRDLLMALHRARGEAESANQLKDEFLLTLSHELRTPLNAILGWTSMLVRGQIPPNRLARVFQSLDRNAQAQAQLIADVLDVSRIITGKLQMQSAVVDVCEIVARAVDTVRPAAAAKGIEIVVPDAADCFIRGDPDRLQQVFWNLLSNAIKFTPAGGSVTVTVARDSGSVAVAVGDTGIGIPSEFVPFVFDRFRQADQRTTRAHGGLGLGLSIVKQLTELHGGSVTASSAGPGLGARFEVRLPAVEAGLLLPEPPTVVPDTARLDGLSILVVDDDESAREVVAAALETAHAHVRVAASAREAAEHLQQHEPALIIADLGMPVEDGFTFIRRLRESGRRHVPAIALSAYANPESRDAALAAGFTAFLAKPARPHTLIELVSTLLQDSSPDPARS